MVKMYEEPTIDFWQRDVTVIVAEFLKVKKNTPNIEEASTFAESCSLLKYFVSSAKHVF